MKTANQQQLKQSELPEFFAQIGARMGLAVTKSSRGSTGRLSDHHELEQFFVAINQRANLAETKQPELNHFFEAITHRLTQAETKQCTIDKRKATGFNVFYLIAPDENKLSDILACLLDPKGGHGQGDLFLRLLFEQMDVTPDAKLTRAAKVQREAPTYGIQKYRRRMDVLVEAGVLLAIENKVDSPEQPDQVKDYLKHLRRGTMGRLIQSRLIYLTPEGKLPESLRPAVVEQYQQNKSLHLWSYQFEFREWLQACRNKCEARKIQDFLSDFISYIDSHLKYKTESNTENEVYEN